MDNNLSAGVGMLKKVGALSYLTADVLLRLTRNKIQKSKSGDLDAGNVGSEARCYMYVFRRDFGVFENKG